MESMLLGRSFSRESSFQYQVTKTNQIIIVSNAMHSFFRGRMISNFLFAGRTDAVKTTNQNFAARVGWDENR